jgi:hypothetical protein
MHLNIKEQGWKENHGIQNTGIEDSKVKTSTETKVMGFSRQPATKQIITA